MQQTKILLIEDYVTLNRDMSDLLRLEGYDVTGVFSGLEALEYVERHGLPDLVLMCLAFPKKYGFEAAEQLKLISDVPIIFLTTGDDKSTIVEALDKYAEDYMVKPVDADELLVRIRRVLRRMEIHEVMKHQADASTSVPTAAPLKKQNDGLRIIYIDADKVIGRIVADQMRYRHRVAVFAEEAPLLALLAEKGPPDMILCSPDERSLDIAERLKSTIDVPIIIVSPYRQESWGATEKVRINAIDTYAEDHLRITFELSELDARMKRVLLRLKPFAE